MPTNNDAKIVFGRAAFTVFLVVVVLIAAVLISQRIPKAERPTLRQPVSTVTVTHSPTATRP